MGITVTMLSYTKKMLHKYLSLLKEENTHLTEDQYIGEKKLSLKVVLGMPGISFSRILMHTVSVFPHSQDKKLLRT